MPNPIIGIAAAGVGSSAIGAAAQSKAASKAADAQSAAADAGVAEQRRQFDAIQELLAPFVGAGTDALGIMGDLAGLGGEEAEAAALSGLERSPTFRAALEQGETGILANAAATGGLRGGNTQAALAQFRPQLFSAALQDRYSRLGGLAGMGQAAATNQASFGQQTSGNISNLLQQQGAAQAGAALGRGQAMSNFAGGIGQSLGSVFGAGIPSGGIPQGQSVFGNWGF